MMMHTNGQLKHYHEDSTVRFYKICSLNEDRRSYVVDRHYGTAESANRRGLWLMQVMGLPTFFLTWEA